MCLGLFALQDNIPSLLKDEERESAALLRFSTSATPFLSSVALSPSLLPLCGSTRVEFSLNAHAMYEIKHHYFSHIIVHGKNDFVERFKILLDTDLYPAKILDFST